MNDPVYITRTFKVVGAPYDPSKNKTGKSLRAELAMDVLKGDNLNVQTWEVTTAGDSLSLMENLKVGDEGVADIEVSCEKKDLGYGLKVCKTFWLRTWDPVTKEAGPTPDEVLNSSNDETNN